ncbi:alpha/beta fold hydrolase [Mucilaginibacter celer]|uniref:Alpha/beta fold hydrolase n=1 Tax=Mucilaginibacter celer TaxID=2305508 RepID=A0A494VNQ1_9SPHI|nr:alpha/beta hydrolase [Mucilaginibacter celer]AYL96324.1 alpha/beta fold hydrolase [Mucilaginibacter celer]
MKILKVSIIIVIFLVGAASLILYSFYKYNDKESRLLTDADRKSVSGNFVKLSQGVTHYQLGGPVGGEPVVLVHGFSVPYYIWDATYQFLVKKGYRVLRYDMYGRGYSDRPYVTYDPALYNNQLLELIKEVKLQGKVSLAGVSFGGAVVSNFSCSHPELINKVILIDPVYEMKKPAAPQYFTLYNEAVNSDERISGQMDDFRYPKQHPGWTKLYAPQMQYKGFRNALVSTLYNYNSGKQTYTCLAGADKPVLLIWGKFDKTVAPRFSDSIRGVLKTDFFPVADAAHLPMIEKADTVNAKILSFLKG